MPHAKRNFIFQCRDISGNLNFDGKAVLRSTGVDFSSGVSFKVNINEFDIQSELGKGTMIYEYICKHNNKQASMALLAKFFTGPPK
jgi:mitogen-activated protein kinase kinase